MTKQKCLLLIFGNALVLLFLATVQLDDLARIVDGDSIVWEVLRILFFTAISGAGIAVLTSTVKRKYTEKEPGLKSVVLVVFVFSSWLYMDYFSAIVHNIYNYRFRAEILNKIEATENGYIRGHKGGHLSRAEYHEIQRMTSFPGMRKFATDISYEYSWCDDITGDNHLSISYNLPVSVKVFTFSFWVPGGSDGGRKVVKKGNLQRVTFTCGLN